MKVVLDTSSLLSLVRYYMPLTEEPRASNDSKLFKKIPAICDILGINSISLPDLLSRSGDIEIKCCKRRGLEIGTK